jgi:hypothetical protein
MEEAVVGEASERIEEWIGEPFTGDAMVDEAVIGEASDEVTKLIEQDGLVPRARDSEIFFFLPLLRGIGVSRVSTGGTGTLVSVFVAVLRRDFDCFDFLRPLGAASHLLFLRFFPSTFGT